MAKRRRAGTRTDGDLLPSLCGAYASLLADHASQDRLLGRAWQNGGIENANVRIKRLLPRQTDLDGLSDEEIQDVAMTLNLTPRKWLGFRSPAEALLNDLGEPLTIRFNTLVALRS